MTYLSTARPLIVLIFILAILISLPVGADAEMKVVPPYWKRFDAGSVSNDTLENACKGDDQALDAFFLAGYVRINIPDVRGHELGQIARNYETLLKRLGDVAFAKALARQRPELQSATTWYLDVSADLYLLKRYPKTLARLSELPRIVWPIDGVSRG